VQDARKGVLFDEFPPVLQLQLKRFEYDFQRDIMVKVGMAVQSVSKIYVPQSSDVHTQTAERAAVHRERSCDSVS
jgi:hypothetical protein